MVAVRSHQRLSALCTLLLWPASLSAADAIGQVVADSGQGIAHAIVTLRRRDNDTVVLGTGRVSPTGSFRIPVADNVSDLWCDVDAMGFDSRRTRLDRIDGHFDAKAVKLKSRIWLSDPIPLPGRTSADGRADSVYLQALVHGTPFDVAAIRIRGTATVSQQTCAGQTPILAFDVEPKFFVERSGHAIGTVTTPELTGTGYLDYDPCASGTFSLSVAYLASVPSSNSQPDKIKIRIPTEIVLQAKGGKRTKLSFSVPSGTGQAGGVNSSVVVELQLARLPGQDMNAPIARITSPEAHLRVNLAPPY